MNFIFSFGSLAVCCGWCVCLSCMWCVCVVRVECLAVVCVCVLHRVLRVLRCMMCCLPFLFYFSLLMVTLLRSRPTYGKMKGNGEFFETKFSKPLFRDELPSTPFSSRHVNTNHVSDFMISSKNSVAVLDQEPFPVRTCTVFFPFTSASCFALSKCLQP